MHTSISSITLCLSIALHLPFVSFAHHPSDPQVELRIFSRHFIPHQKESNCAQCLPGWGIVSVCNRTRPTVCTPCEINQWSPKRPHLKTCRPCSKCGSGLYEQHKCSRIHDTHCGWCHAVHGKITPDFYRKCEKTQLAIAKTIEEQRRNQHNSGIPDDGEKIHEFWDFNQDGSFDNLKIEMKPSYRHYDDKTASSAISSTDWDREMYLMIASVSLIVVCLLTLFLWLLQKFCRLDYEIRNNGQNLYDKLTQQDHRSIYNCVQRLRSNGKLMYAQNEQLEDDYWEDDEMHGVENPLIHLIGDDNKMRII